MRAADRSRFTADKAFFVKYLWIWIADFGTARQGISRAHQIPCQTPWQGIGREMRADRLGNHGTHDTLRSWCQDGEVSPRTRTNGRLARRSTSSPGEKPVPGLMSSSTPPPTRPRPTASRIGPGTARVKALAVLADVAKKAQAGPIVAAKALPGALNARQCLRH